MKSKRKALAVSVVLIILLAAWIAYGDQNIGLTTYEVKVGGLPKAFEGLRIVQLSDLHNETFPDGNGQLISLTARAKPDMIFITGDMLDSGKTDIPAALNVAEQAAAIAPVYYVTGNHEARIGEYRAFEQSLEELGVMVLRNRTVQLEKDGKVLNIAGVDDPAFFDADDEEKIMDMILDQLDAEGCTLLLSHRPELFDAYAEYDIALTFSGHTHGGQIRLPLIGGLYGPHQGFFPEYDGGLYQKAHSAMIVSRGIGNSLFPFRVNNDPEVVLAILECE